MNRLVQHLRFGISLRRSNWTWLPVQPVLRMSGNCLIQRHAISYSRVSASYVSYGCSCCVRPIFAKSLKNPRSNFRIQKSTPPVRSEYANGNETSAGGSGFRPTSLEQIIQYRTSSPLESWRLWQKVNCSVKDICRKRGLTELQVYEQICECVQQGREIDWFELCQEAAFSPAIVLEINDAKAKADEAMNEPLGQRLDEFGRVPVQCGHHVTDVHVLIYNTLMACGITPHEIFFSAMEGLPSQVPEKLPTPKKASFISKPTTESKRVAAADVPAPNVKLITSSDRSPATEEADSKKQTPKRLTQKHMLQWMADRNGVTLIDLVLEFQGYNECQLMRLILLLERKKLIQLSQGIFRVTSSDEESTL